MSPIKIAIVTRKAKEIKKDLLELEKYSRMDKKDYLTSYEAQLSSERLLEKIIGRMIDINFHILKEKHGVLPNDYFQSFMLMGEKKEISSDLASDLASAAGMRNVLAHEYDAIDNQMVYEAIHRALIQVPEYLKKVVEK